MFTSNVTSLRYTSIDIKLLITEINNIYNRGIAEMNNNL